eukprot:1179465-Prorocentrum_minimum.AAC.13
MTELVNHAPPLTATTLIERLFQISDGGFLEIRNYGEIIRKLSRVGHDLPIPSYVTAAQRRLSAHMLSANKLSIAATHHHRARPARERLLEGTLVEHPPQPLATRGVDGARQQMARVVHGAARSEAHRPLNGVLHGSNPTEHRGGGASGGWHVAQPVEDLSHPLLRVCWGSPSRDTGRVYNVAVHTSGSRRSNSRPPTCVRVTW